MSCSSARVEKRRMPDRALRQAVHCDTSSATDSGETKNARQGIETSLLRPSRLSCALVEKRRTPDRALRPCPRCSPSSRCSPRGGTKNARQGIETRIHHYLHVSLGWRNDE